MHNTGPCHSKSILFTPRCSHQFSSHHNLHTWFNSIHTGLCLRLPFQVYTKVCKAYFTLMELLMRNHTATLVELDTPVLKHICTSLQAGLKSHEVRASLLPNSAPLTPYVPALVSFRYPPTAPPFTLSPGGAQVA
jgi:hypothetical protein